MAFNWQTFRTRTLTAVVFVIVMAAGLFWNRVSFFVLFSVVHFGCWMEYDKLVTKFNPEFANRTVLHRFGLPIAGWCLMLAFASGFAIGSVNLYEIGFYTGLVLALLIPLAEVASRKLLLKNIGYSITGLLYISLPLALLIDMRHSGYEDHPSLSFTVPLLTIFSLWINDTMAYIVGSFIGKHSLSKISPKKTWEGTIGGILLTIAVIGALAWYTGRIEVHHACIMAALAGITGTFGDLAESKLKRLAGVKDSGTIMPGHGGFLDRFDSLLFAAIAVWFYASFFLMKP
jgi:phosphatidate cytidylyltransferase